MPPEFVPSKSDFNDLRGQTVRSVHRDDAVIITGAEYMRLRRQRQKLAQFAEWMRRGRGPAPLSIEDVDQIIGEVL